MKWTRSIAGVVAAVASATAIPAVATAAGGVAYLDGPSDARNVVLSSPDGATKVQVTTDGGAAASYVEVAHAERGSIAAATGSGSGSATLSLHSGPGLERQSIQVLPRRLSGGLQVYPISLAVNADGRIASYGHSSCGFACQTLSRGTWIAFTTTLNDPTNPLAYSHESTTFVGDRLIGVAGGDAYVQRAAGAPFTQDWDPWPMPTAETILEVSASIGARQFAAVLSSADGTSILVGDHDGSLPSPATRSCTLPAVGAALSPSFSPDGSRIAWQDDQGIKVAGVPDLSAGGSACTMTAPPTVISATGVDPSFGGADAAGVAAARAGTPGDGGTPPPGEASPPRGTPPPSGAGVPPGSAPFACALPVRPRVLSLPATRAQIVTNQRIAVAMMRRLNAINAKRAGKPTPRTRPATFDAVRATTAQLRTNQRISEAAYRRAKALYDTLGGAGAMPPRSLATRITFNRAGVGLNQLTNIRALDMLNCINRNMS